jgi:hypothetical protein
MQWLKPRETLKISIEDINYLGKVNPVAKKWRQTREEILKIRNQSCRYCGGKYSKYLICFHLDCNQTNNSPKNLEMCCRACYIITHLNYGFLNSITLCWSKLSQIDIIKKTIEMSISNNSVPDITDVDPDAKKSPLSVMELCCILKMNKKDIIKNIKKIKVFFTKDFDITFTNFYCKSDNINKKISRRPMCLDDSDSDSDNDEDLDIVGHPTDTNLQNTNLTSQTDKMLKDLFRLTPDNNITIMMNKALHKTNKILSEYNNTSKKVDIAYDIMCLGLAGIEFNKTSRHVSSTKNSILKGHTHHILQ